MIGDNVSKSAFLKDSYYYLVVGNDTFKDNRAISYNYYSYQ